MEILFITGNKEKIKIAENEVKNTNIKIIPKKIECIEIQDDDNLNIANYSSKYASDLTKSTVVKIDTGFYIEELNGFPGPYAEYVERKLTSKEILNLMKGKPNRRAYYKEVLSYCEKDKEPVCFTSYTYGTIAYKESGCYGYNFDKIFIVKNDDKTIANYNDEERILKYNNSWKKLINYLNTRNSWALIYKKDILKKGGNVPYIINKISKKKKLIDLVQKYSNNKKIIECGSGTSVLSIYLSSIGYNVKCVDIEEDVIKLSQELSNDYFKYINKKGKIEFKKQSIFNLKYKRDEFDVAFSNGVLEHFTDEEIINTLKQQLYISKTLIVGIPTKYFESKEAKYGNERVLPLSYWRKLIIDSGGKIIEEKGMHREPFKKRILNYKKYFKPKPYHLFVVKKLEK